jgi:predicted Zn-dependent peptidase
MKVDDQRVESLARKQFNRMIFGADHPYGVIGEIRDIAPVQSSSLIDFHRRVYIPSRCRILITGPKPDRYLPLVEKFFGDGWSPTQPDVIRGLPVLPPIPTGQGALDTIARPDAVQTAIRVGKTVISRMDIDYQGLTIVNTLLGGFFGSRLMSNIREEKGYTYGISSHLLALKDTGYFVIGSTVAADRWQETLTECKKEIDRLQNDLVEADELELVRNYLTGQVQRSVDGPFQVADQYRALWMHGLDLNYLSGFMSVIGSLTPEEIRNLACKHLDYTNMAIAVAGPVQTPD